MPLPILQSGVADSGDLPRLFLRAELHWARHLGEETQLDVGTAIHNPDLPDVPAANCIRDATLPAGVAPDAALTEAESHFAAHGVRPRRWTLAPATPPALADHLRASGYAEDRIAVLYLRHGPLTPPPQTAGLTILPARAALRHARQLADDEACERNVARLADARMLHLDDPHTDALIALHGGQAVASIALLAVGEVGLIQDLYVHPNHRRQRIGTMMIDRAMEICARSQFRHVFLSAAAHNEAAMRLFAPAGFVQVAEVIDYIAPA